MSTSSLLDQEWQRLLDLLPANRDEAARHLGAFTRQRQIKTSDDLLRLAFVYAWSDLSLRSTAAWSRHKQLAALSDVALLERLQKAQVWLGWLLSQTICAHSRAPALSALPYRVRVIDATVLTQPGSQGTDWRVHLSLELQTQHIQALELTDAHGGETFTRWEVQKEDLFVADRGYAHRRGLAHVVGSGGQALVRFSWQNLPLQQPDGTPFDLIGALSTLDEEEIGEWAVQTTPDASANLPAISGRVIAVPKSEQAAETARRQARKSAKKKGQTPDARTLVCCSFVLLFTSVPAESLDAPTLVALYRFRWQIECGFKRLKSIVHLDALPAQEARLCRAWLYTKLLGALLVEILSSSWASFSPWGNRCPTRGLALASVAEHLALLATGGGDRIVSERVARRSQDTQTLVLRPAA